MEDTIELLFFCLKTSDLMECLSFVTSMASNIICCNYWQWALSYAQSIYIIVCSSLLLMSFFSFEVGATDLLPGFSDDGDEGFDDDFDKMVDSSVSRIYHLLSLPICTFD